jgi:hypothetical protein
MKLISFAAARQLRYVRLCHELDWSGDIRDPKAWGDMYEVNGTDDHFDNPRCIEGYPSDVGRFMLCERSRYGQKWVTLFDSIDEAAAANVNQEYAEDWFDAIIVDLATGAQFDIEYRAVAIPRPREEVNT